MKTEKQILGDWGERIIQKNCSCPKCKKNDTFKLLPSNFKCADIICDFCGFLAQVKTSRVKNIEILPKKILGAAWKPQKERMDHSIYFPLYLVLENNEKYSIFYLSTDFQYPPLFQPRPPLKETAVRAGWQGFY